VQSVETERERATASADKDGRALLSVVDVRKSFASPAGDRIDVLRGVTLEARAGETVAITGASGSGKSTLLHLLGGLEDPDHGSIAFANVELRNLKPDELADFRQRSIGFVFQFHYLLPDLSAAENVALPLRISRHDPATSLNATRALLTEMGLDDRADFPATHLSGGEQQRVAVARALVTSPTLLLADEPTGNLDASIGDEIGRTLVNYVRRQNGVAIIATHNETLANLCDRVLLLERGRLQKL
jgi:lipoprotein-releasing system ATP-binding protein